MKEPNLFHQRVYNKIIAALLFQTFATMITSQTFMINLLKSKVLSKNPKLLQSNRMYVEQKQIKLFWEKLPLYQMESLLTIHNYRIVQYISEYLNYFLNEKKTVVGNEAYCICKENKGKTHGKQKINGNSQQVQFYVYDCKIFKSPGYEKQQNDMLSAFLVVWKHLEESLMPKEEEQNSEEEIYQFVDKGVFGKSTMIFKCKASALLKIFAFFKVANLDSISGDTIAIPEEQYYEFLCDWMYCSQSDHIEYMIRHLFKGLIILLQNSIILEFMESLNEDEKQIRRYEKPVCVIVKPGYTESYTMIDSGLGDVEWHTLKIKAFKLKYKVWEDEKSYVCTRIKEPEYFLNHEQIKYDPEYLKEGDTAILAGFQKCRNDQYSPQNYQYYA